MIEENFVGTDCTGSDGEKNRTLTISNTSETDNNNFQVFVNNSFLHLNVDYTIVHNTSGTAITFLNRVWDEQNITVIYTQNKNYLKTTITEEYTGGDCSGSDGDSNRTLTLSNTNLTIQEGFLVFVNNSFLHLNNDYTVVHNSSSTIITFLNSLFDSQTVTVKYYSMIITASSSAILPLDTQYINNELNSFGNTVTIRAMNKLDEDSYGNAQIVWGDSKIYYKSGDDSLESFYDSNWIAQTFTVGSSSIDVSSIKLKVKRTGTPGAITVSIKAVDGDNKPTGNDLTSGSLDYTDLLDDAETGWIVLPLTSYNLSASTMYSIVIREASGDASNKYESRKVTTGTYASGNNLTSSDSGSSWTAGSSDILFEIFGDTETVAMVDVLGMDDELVTLGQFQTGDLRLNFQNSESNIDRGTKVKYKYKWYQIDSLESSSMGDIDYFKEAIARKI